MSMSWRKNEMGARVFVQYMNQVNIVGNDRFVRPKVIKPLVSYPFKFMGYKVSKEDIEVKVEVVGK